MAGMSDGVALLAVAAAAFSVHAALDAVPQERVGSLLKLLGARRSDGIDTRSLVHAALAGTGAAVVLWIESQKPSLAEPASSFQCLPASSRIAWALPAFELGYALHDLRQAIAIGSFAFIAHGALVSTMLGLVCYLGVAHHLSRVFVVHLSSVFLHLRRADFGHAVNDAIDLSFAASFFVLRLLLLPWWWVRFLSHAASTDPATWGSCMNGRIVAVATIGGLVIHCLDAYWAMIIAKRIAAGRHSVRVAASTYRDEGGIGRSSAEGHYRSAVRATDSVTARRDQ